jgi:hypothetical protein
MAATPDGPKFTDFHPLLHSVATLRQTGMHPKSLRSCIGSRRLAGLNPISYAAIPFVSRADIQDRDTTILRSRSSSQWWTGSRLMNLSYFILPSLISIDSLRLSLFRHDPRINDQDSGFSACVGVRELDE